MPTQQALEQAATTFFQNYRGVLFDQDDISDTLGSFLNLLDNNVSFTY